MMNHYREKYEELQQSYGLLQAINERLHFNNTELYDQACEAYTDVVTLEREHEQTLNSYADFYDATRSVLGNRPRAMEEIQAYIRVAHELRTIIPGLQPGEQVIDLTTDEIIDLTDL